MPDEARGLDPTFGYTTAGGSFDEIADDIRGSVFTIAENGQAQSITWYGRYGTSGTKVKCAIYKHSDLSLVGSTEEIAGGTTVQWNTHNFAAPKPALIANTAYILVAWGQTATYLPRLHYDTGDTNQGHEQALTYDSWPDPLVPVHSTRKFSIYCTYTVPTAYTQTISDILGMVDSVSKQLTLKKTITDILGMLDSVATRGALKKSVSDILGMLDSVPTRAAFRQAVSDVLGLTDSAARTRHVFQAVSESLGLSDSVGTKAAFKQAVSDILGLVDSAARARGFPVTISEILGLRDRVEARRRAGKIGDLPDDTITGGAP